MPKRVAQNAWSSIVAIAIVAFLFVSLYVLGGVKRERFLAKDVPSYMESQLIKKDNIVVFQGSQMPESEPNKAVVWDQGDPSVNTVDGKEGSPKSMFMFTYNDCKPECCDYSPYSCSGGCVCMTKDQVDFVGSRGSNNQPRRCSPDESIF